MKSGPSYFFKNKNFFFIIVYDINDSIWCNFCSARANLPYPLLYFRIGSFRVLIQNHIDRKYKQYNFVATTKKLCGIEHIFASFNFVFFFTGIQLHLQTENRKQSKCFTFRVTRASFSSLIKTQTKVINFISFLNALTGFIFRILCYKNVAFSLFLIFNL